MGTRSEADTSLTERINAHKKRLEQHESSRVPAELRDDTVGFIDETVRHFKVSRRTVLSDLGINRSTYYDWKNRFGSAERDNTPVPKSNKLHPLENAAIEKFYNLYWFFSCKRLALMMIDQDILYVAPRTMNHILRSLGYQIRSMRDVGRLFHSIGSAQTADEQWVVSRLRIAETSKVGYLVFAVDAYSGMIIDWNLHEIPFEYEDVASQEAYMDDYMQKFTRFIRRHSRNQTVKIEKCNDSIVTLESIFRLSKIAAMYWEFFSKERYPQRKGISRFKWNTIITFMNRHHSLLDETIQDHVEWPLFWDKAIQTVLTLAIEFYNDNLPQSSLDYFTPRTVYEGKTAAVDAERERKLNAARKHRTFDWIRIRRILEYEPQQREDEDDLPEPEFEEDPAQSKFQF